MLYLFLMAGQEGWELLAGVTEQKPCFNLILSFQNKLFVICTLYLGHFPTQIPKLHRPCCFNIKRLLQNDEKNPRMCRTHAVTLKEAAFPEDKRSGVTRMFIMKGERWWKCGVSGCPGMLTDDKVPGLTAEPATPPEAGFIP